MFPTLRNTESSEVKKFLYHPFWGHKVKQRPLLSYTSVFQRKRSEAADSMDTTPKYKLDTTFAKAIQRETRIF